MRISVMRTIGVLALAAMLFASVNALAQFGGLLGTSRSTPAGSSYVGPLDAAGISATACYSLRACSASYATGSNNAITVRRASDNTTTNVLILSNGNLDVASAATFAGTDATCTGTISGTTLSVTSCASGTLHVNDPISGTGITAPAFITAIGTCASPPGTCTLNASQTVGSAETITGQVALFVTTAFDQTGNGNNVVQAVNASQPQLLPACNGTLPCLYVQSSAQQLASSSSVTPSATAVSLSAVGNRIISNTGNTPKYISEGSNFIYSNPALNSWSISGSSHFNETATDGAWHAANGVVAGASSVLNVDGTETTGSITTSTAPLPWIWASGGGSFSAAFQEGIGFDGVTLTSTQRNAICANQFAYWGTSTPSGTC